VGGAIVGTNIDLWRFNAADEIEAEGRRPVALMGFSHGGISPWGRRQPGPRRPSRRKASCQAVARSPTMAGTETVRATAATYTYPEK